MCVCVFFLFFVKIAAFFKVGNFTVVANCGMRSLFSI